MHRRLFFRIGAWGLLIVLILALYREWVIRSRPPIFLPLGFFESVIHTDVLEEDPQDPERWIDPLSPIVVDPTTFGLRAAGATQRSTDMLIHGATLGGLSAAISAAEDGATVTLVSDEPWQSAIRAQAALFIAEEPRNASASVIDRSLRAYLASHAPTSPVRPQKGTPDDVVAFFEERLSTLPNITVLSSFTTLAFAKNDRGLLEQALVQPLQGGVRIAIRFGFLLDGTMDGSTLALAGVRTNTSWDDKETTSEAGALPHEAVVALAEGYTMSGRSIPGIGRRLDGALGMMALLDRGYHGRFIAPNDSESCWLGDESVGAPQPFVLHARVLRATTVGCAAHTTIASAFDDTVEVFFINHGNDSLSASVDSEGMTLSLASSHNPTNPFVRLGAFSVGPTNPLRITLYSTLPTDHLEGFIVRKLNVGRSERLSMQSQVDATLHAGPWQQTLYDIYVRAENDTPSHTLTIDDTSYPLQPVGPDTFMLRAVPVSHGEHTLHFPEEMDVKAAWAIPTSPAGQQQELHRLETTGAAKGAPFTSSGSWNITATRSGIGMLSIPTNTCARACQFIVTPRGESAVLAEGTLPEQSGMIPPSIVLSSFELHEGTSYTVTIMSMESSIATPMLSLTDEHAMLYASGIKTASVIPPQAGMLYDLWIHTLRSESANVRVGKSQRSIEARTAWRYIGTELLSAHGMEATSGGGIELLAIPNVKVDTYHLPLAANAGAAHITELPPGLYTTTSVGSEAPRTVQFMQNGNDIQHLTFDQSDEAYVATDVIARHTGDAQLQSTSPLPQHIVLHERLPTQAITQSGMDAAPLTIMQNSLRTSNTSPASTIAAPSKGLLLFQPYRRGIGPVTIGSLGESRTEERVRTAVETAFSQLRYGNVTINLLGTSCLTRDTPDCDRRRYVRDPSVFDTFDAQPAHAVYPDGRRLVGNDTLTDSMITRRSCTYCDRECIPGTQQYGQCVHPEDAAIPHVPDAVLTLRGTARDITMLSPREHETTLGTTLFETMREHGLIEEKTYFEQRAIPTDITVSLGMFIPETHINVLPAETTISMTHAASRTIRSPSASIAIGAAAGHIATFALRQERVTLDLLLSSAALRERLQLYLIDRGVTVLGPGSHTDDPLLAKALQYRLLTNKSTLHPIWENRALRTAITIYPDPQHPLLKATIFGSDAVRTMRDALTRLPGTPADSSDGALLRFGVETGFVQPSMLTLRASEILQLELHDEQLLAAEYLFATRP